MAPSRLVLNWVLKHKIYLFNMYLLSFYSVTSAVLDGRGKGETKTEKGPALRQSMLWLEQKIINNKQDIIKKREVLNVQRQFFMNVLHFCLSCEQRH